MTKKIYRTTDRCHYCAKCGNVDRDLGAKCPNCKSEFLEPVVGAIEFDAQSRKYCGDTVHYFSQPDMFSIVERPGFEPFNPNNGLILRKSESSAPLYRS